MSRVRVESFSLSLDGFGAGPAQDLGIRSAWVERRCLPGLFPTRTFRRMFEGKDGTTGVDDGFAARGFEGVGAWILGRNMFGPIRGRGPTESWKGWWGEEPPYHVPVFVLTHHPRRDLADEGWDDLPLRRRRESRRRSPAPARQPDRADVRLGGGVSTIRQYLEAGWWISMHLAYSPVLLGKGENLLAGLDLPRPRVPGHRAGGRREGDACRADPRLNPPFALAGPPATDLHRGAAPRPDSAASSGGPRAAVVFHTVLGP
jgi:dihydrofolate reductase